MYESNNVAEQPKKTNTKKSFALVCGERTIRFLFQFSTFNINSTKNIRLL